MNKIQSLREMTRGELVQKKTDLEDELFNLQMRRSVKTLDNPLRLRTIGRDMARILTVLNEDKRGIRSLAEASMSVLSGSEARPKTKGD